jgi:hypothetical protein
MDALAVDIAKAGAFNTCVISAVQCFTTALVRLPAVRNVRRQPPQAGSGMPHGKVRTAQILAPVLLCMSRDEAVYGWGWEWAAGSGAG